LITQTVKKNLGNFSPPGEKKIGRKLEFFYKKNAEIFAKINKPSKPQNWGKEKHCTQTMRDIMLLNSP